MVLANSKICSSCKSLKFLSEFYRDSNPRNKTGKQSRCIDCCKRQSETYRLAHPEWKAEQDKKYRKRHPDICKQNYKSKVAARPKYYAALAAERQRRYRERNPGCGLKGNAERLRRWRIRHPERQASWGAARRVAMKRIPIWGEPEKIEIVYQKAKEWGFEVDHIIPLKHDLVCGLHVWHNLQLLDRNLNRVKHNQF